MDMQTYSVPTLIKSSRLPLLQPRIRNSERIHHGPWTNAPLLLCVHRMLYYTSQTNLYNRVKKRGKKESESNKRRAIYIARHALNHKPQNIFINYLHIYLSSLQHLLNHLLNHFNRYCFLPTVEKYQRGENFLFVKKHTQRCRIYIRRFLLLV